MIKSFKSKALKAYWEEGKPNKLPPAHVKKISKILTLLASMSSLSDLDSFRASFRPHPLHKPPYIGFISLDVTGNFRIIFEFIDNDVYNVEYLDTH